MTIRGGSKNTRKKRKVRKVRKVRRNTIGRNSQSSSNESLPPIKLYIATHGNRIINKDALESEAYEPEELSAISRNIYYTYTVPTSIRILKKAPRGMQSHDSCEMSKPTLDFLLDLDQDVNIFEEYKKFSMGDITENIEIDMEDDKAYKTKKNPLARTMKSSRRKLDEMFMIEDYQPNDVLPIVKNFSNDQSEEPGFCKGIYFLLDCAVNLPKYHPITGEIIFLQKHVTTRGTKLIKRYKKGYNLLECPLFTQYISVLRKNNPEMVSVTDCDGESHIILNNISSSELIGFFSNQAKIEIIDSSCDVNYADEETTNKLLELIRKQKMQRSMGHHHSSIRI
jgi:hypothetical protein